MSEEDTSSSCWPRVASARERERVHGFSQRGHEIRRFDQCFTSTEHPPPRDCRLMKRTTKMATTLRLTVDEVDALRKALLNEHGRLVRYFADLHCTGYSAAAIQVCCQRSRVEALLDRIDMLQAPVQAVGRITSERPSSTTRLDGLAA